MVAKAWVVYLKERFPVPVYVLLCGGIAFSAWKWQAWPFDFTKMSFSFLGLFLFFAVLRLMDEWKDREKDKVAHPTRPIPRGVIGEEQAQTAIQKLVICMVLFSIAVAVNVSVASALWYLALTGYLWLMFREFYVGSWLEPRPLLYALSHQVILIPLCVFASSVFGPITEASWLYSLLVLGSFFTYEISRKQDPSAHPILKNYRQTHGAYGSLGIVLGALALATWAAWKLGIDAGNELKLLRLFLPVHLVLVATYFLKTPKAHKLTEGLATLGLLLHLWSGWFAGVGEIR